MNALGEAHFLFSLLVYILTPVPFTLHDTDKLTIIADSLNLANNHFEGEFPMEWTGMAGLQVLDISSKQLRGEIPLFIDGMKNLRTLNMASNDFSSTIPKELGR